MCVCVCVKRLMYSTAIMCEELENPENGLVEFTSRLPGSTATYTCDAGFNLIGSQTRTCLNNGFWSGVVSICQGRPTVLYTHF